MFNPSDRTPDMSIDVSLGEFHQTHEDANKAISLISARIDQLSVPQLRDALTKLRAGQRLTDAEAGDDFMFAQSYYDEIELVEAELNRRGELA